MKPYLQLQAVDGATQAGTDRIGFAKFVNICHVTKELCLDTALAKSVLDNIVRHVLASWSEMTDLSADCRRSVACRR